MKAKKPAKIPGPTPISQDAKGVGHNSGVKNPQVIKYFDEMDTIEVRMKQDGKNLREIRNRLKTEFGILNQTTAHERKLRKLDPDVRTQFESNHQDLKHMLGYQPSLDFVNGQPTAVSVKVQPPEAELVRKPAETSFTGGPVPYQPDVQTHPEPTAEPTGPSQQPTGVIQREG